MKKHRNKFLVMLATLAIVAAVNFAGTQDTTFNERLRRVLGTSGTVSETNVTAISTFKVGTGATAGWTGILTNNLVGATNYLQVAGGIVTNVVKNP